ncbi:MAG: hypothetical protein ACJ75H_06205 [Thermoanaerobaculia bacterium]
MNRRKLPYVVVAMVLLTALTLPGTASAATPGHVRGQADVWAWFSGLLGRVVSLVTPADATTQRKGGLGIDPNGLIVGDGGGGIDPNGIGTGDAGSGIDPNG